MRWRKPAALDRFSGILVMSLFVRHFRKEVKDVVLPQRSYRRWLHLRRRTPGQNGTIFLHQGVKPPGRRKILHFAQNNNVASSAYIGVYRQFNKSVTLRSNQRFPERRDCRVARVCDPALLAMRARAYPDSFFVAKKRSLKSCRLSAAEDAEDTEKSKTYSHANGFLTLCRSV